MITIAKYPDEVENEILELSTKDIVKRENKKKYKNGENKEKYKIKGTKKLVRYIGKSKPKKREVR